METSSDAKYSVLMPVYAAVEPGQLDAAIGSMLGQTLPTDDFVLVCDGPLPPALDRVVEGFARRHPQIFRVLRLPRHQGLVAALNAGLPLCRHDLVARMDSDDISLPHRCARQADFLLRNPDIAVLSGTVLEFWDMPTGVTGKRSLPGGHQELCFFSGRRSPFNHPAVMYRRAAVAAAGGYRNTFPLFEDYDLWVRMQRAGFRGENLREPLLFMRTGLGMYRRRGGPDYAGQLLRFQRYLCREGWSTPADFLTGAVPHALVCLLPIYGLALVYRELHRKGEKYGYQDPHCGYGALRPCRYLPGL